MLTESFWVECALEAPTRLEYGWCETVKAATGALRELSRVTLTKDQQKRLKAELLQKRKEHAERLVQGLRKSGVVDIELAWRSLEDKVLEADWLKSMSRDDIAALIDATAWGYTKEGTGDLTGGRLVVEGMAKPLGMTQEAVRSCISEVLHTFECPACGKAAAVHSPCASLASFAHPVRLECQHCNHRDVLARAPSHGFDKDLRAIGGRLKCVCVKCELERIEIGTRAAMEMRASVERDLGVVASHTRSAPWLQSGGQGHRWSSTRERSDKLLKTIQDRMSALGTDGLSGEKVKEVLQACADESYRPDIEPEQRLAWLCDDGWKSGWLVLQEVAHDTTKSGGRELAFRSLMQAADNLHAKVQTEIELEWIFTALKAGRPEAFERLMDFHYARDEVHGAARFRLAYDTEFESRPEQPTQEVGALDGVMPEQPAVRDEVPDMGGINLMQMLRGGTSGAGKRGSPGDEDDLIGRLGEDQAEGRPVSETRAKEDARGARKPVVRGLGERAHLASNDRLLSNAQPVVRWLIRTYLQSDASLVRQISWIERECVKLLQPHGLKSLQAAAIGRHVRARALEVASSYEPTGFVLGKTLLEVKKGARGERDVPNMRADFEVEFEADAFTIEVTRKRQGASAHAMRLEDLIGVTAEKHRFRVVGAVLGGETKLGEAVDLLRDLEEAALTHYDDQRCLQEAFYARTDHPGCVMFMTDDASLFETLRDQFDGVLVGTDGAVEKWTFEGIELDLAAEVTVVSAQ